jgi:hypothetical protein
LNVTLCFNSLALQRNDLFIKNGENNQDADYQQTDQNHQAYYASDHIGIAIVVSVIEGSAVFSKSCEEQKRFQFRSKIIALYLSC